MTIVSIILVLGLATWLVFRPKSKPSGLKLPDVFPREWRTFLMQKVAFYTSLNEDEKLKFEQDIITFLHRVRITGVKTDVIDQDRLLVASSAVIPVFAFDDWMYSSLQEVLLYPNLFTADFSLEGERRNISGMVGSGGVMNKIVIFSKPALHQGFDVTTDKKNVGVHEFVHLFDKEDGTIDGIPNVIMNQPAVLPWLNLIQQKTKEMLNGDSDINLYGATNDQEFLAVAAEYFFERPKLLAKKHLQLYQALSKVFQTDLAESYDPVEVKRTIGRNDPCPCQSGKKFKRCCMTHN